MDIVQDIMNLAERTKQAIPLENGDYIDDDGLICCGKCKTRKQDRYTLFDGRVVTPMHLCKCAQEQKEREEAERKKAEKMEQVKRLRKIGFPEAEMTRWTFENDDQGNKELSRIARNYVRNFAEMKKKHKGLLLYGNVGSGKTYIAASIANALVDEGYPCLVTNFARLINTIQGMYEGKQEYIDSLDKFDLLVIDDLASERDTEYMNEIIFNIIDARYRNGKPLIITTNLSIKELGNPEEIRKQRVYSRLLEMCVPVQVNGRDRRRARPDDDILQMLGM